MDMSVIIGGILKVDSDWQVDHGRQLSSRQKNLDISRCACRPR